MVASPVRLPPGAALTYHNVPARFVSGAAQDAREYLPVAAQAGVRAQVRSLALADANRALADLREGAFVGAAVLVP